MATSHKLIDVYSCSLPERSLTHLSYKYETQHSFQLYEIFMSLMMGGVSTQNVGQYETWHTVFIQKNFQQYFFLIIYLESA